MLRMMSADIFAIALDEDRALGSAAEGFQTDGARAGEEVDDQAVDDELADDIEEGLADQVARRPRGGRSSGTVDLVTAPLSGDDPHG